MCVGLFLLNSVSAADRTATIRALADAYSAPDDFARPGHIFPLRARDGAHAIGWFGPIAFANVAVSQAGSWLAPVTLRPQWTLRG